MVGCIILLLLLVASLCSHGCKPCAPTGVCTLVSHLCLRLTDCSDVGCRTKLKSFGCEISLKIWFRDVVQCSDIYIFLASHVNGDTHNLKKEKGKKCCVT